MGAQQGRTYNEIVVKEIDKCKRRKIMRMNQLQKQRRIE
jgi:hypothetical protein